jgi:hypothetical protein
MPLTVFGRSDKFGAIFMARQPYLPLTGSSHRLIADDTQGLLYSEAKSFGGILNAGHISLPLGDVLRRMIYLTKWLASRTTFNTSETQLVAYLNYCAEIFHRLYAFDWVVSAGPETSIKEKSCQLAALIFATAAFHGCSTKGPLCALLARQLQDCLAETGLKGVWNDCEHFLLWIVFTGASVEAEEGVRKWFTSLASQICTAKQLYSWREVQRILKGYLWLEGISNTCYSKVWWETAAKLQLSGVHVDQELAAP